MDKKLKTILIVVAVIVVIGVLGFYGYQQAKIALKKKVGELTGPKGAMDIQNMMMQFAVGGAGVCEKTPEDKKPCYTMFALREKNDSYCPKTGGSAKFIEACKKSVQAMKEGKSIVEAYAFISAVEDAENPPSEPPTAEEPPAKEKNLLDAKTYEEGLAMCNADPIPLCYFFLGGMFNKPEVCNYVAYDPDTYKECTEDAANGFAKSKEMVEAYRTAQKSADQ
ncbi:MAG: hypothetical protein WC449_00800 [Candidatus Paceibacterota bacterium]